MKPIIFIVGLLFLVGCTTQSTCQGPMSWEFDETKIKGILVCDWNWSMYEKTGEGEICHSFNNPEEVYDFCDKGFNFITKHCTASNKTWSLHVQKADEGYITCNGEVIK